MEERMAKTVEQIYEGMNSVLRTYRETSINAPVNLTLAVLEVAAQLAQLNQSVAALLARSSVPPAGE